MPHKRLAHGCLCADNNETVEGLQGLSFAAAIVRKRLLELPSREEAVAWAARLAKACRCEQELRVFGLVRVDGCAGRV
jgi:hypothetical protein